MRKVDATFGHHALQMALVQSFRDAQNLVYVFRILLQPIVAA